VGENSRALGTQHGGIANLAVVRRTSHAILAMNADVPRSQQARMVVE
jgi:hypothetical protein